MTHETKNVPDLRFPEFKNEWATTHLKDLGNFTSGGTPLKKKKAYWNGDIPWLTTGDINGKEIHKANNYITQEGMENSSAKLINKEAILIAMYGQGKTRGMASIINFEATTNQACAIFQTNNDIKFIHQLFRKDYYKLRSLSNDGSQKNLSLSLLKNYKIVVPEIEEQRKIGGFFNKLDQQIELEEQKLEKLEEQKKGYMQQIFSQKLRFKDENNNDYPEWKEQKLYEVVKYLSSKRSSNNYSENIMQGDYPVYDAIQEISKDVNFDIKEPYISILKDGAGVGRLNLRPGKSSVIGTMGYLLPENIDINFLFYYLKTMNFNKFVIGSTIPHLYFKDYSKETIFVPKNEEEQFKIGSFFIKLDKVIENKSDKIELLKERKKGFLQRMFV
ncbi:restriction endonuclease subunit S [Staphylococcus xylosus]|uniref:restriction endonuclease subunit S n=1 Tax=Staphylococcus xylosus TaxID=1288 RepID=UPI002DB7E6E8|nr:restriction endonuclease subunit S [Staphylococcus xylosus]MEB8121471.1 restriction endonuclease subunit S [Staphylococcus xylosus]